MVSVGCAAEKTMAGGGTLITTMLLVIYGGCFAISAIVALVNSVMMPMYYSALLIMSEHSRIRLGLLGMVITVQ
jgi:hypothetical protein